MRLEPSPFDSRHYALRIGRLVEPTVGELRPTLAAARADGYDVVVVRVADDDPVRAALDRAGHAPVDVLVTSTLGPARPLAAATTDAIEEHPIIDDPADVAAVAGITTASIQTSHLHADPRLPRERTDALYAEWVRNDLAGRAARTFLARDRGAVVGYLTAVAQPDHVMIDLVAVDPAHHGRGLGTALIGAFIAWVDARGAVATVGTQRDNPALRLYARCGFVPARTQFTYHLWLDR